MKNEMQSNDIFYVGIRIEGMKTRRNKMKQKRRRGGEVQRGGQRIPTSDLIALDCEMIGINRRSMLAQVVLVDSDGNVVYSAYVKPPVYASAEGTTVNYRTEFSGITKEALDLYGKSFTSVQTRVADLLKGKILVGHALENDLKALRLTHPADKIIDTAHLPVFQKPNPVTGFPQPRRLKDLAKEVLGWTIQEGPHDPAEDARAAMALVLVQGNVRNIRENVTNPHTRRRVRV